MTSDRIDLVRARPILAIRAGRQPSDSGDQATGDIGHSPGDPHLAEVAWRDHRTELLAFAARATRNAAAADDLVQEAYARLVGEIRGGRPPANVRAWLYRVVTNLAVSRMRRDGSALRWLQRQAFSGRGPSPEEILLDREHRTEVDVALARLAPDARIGLLLAAQGFTGREVAQAIGRTENATRTLLSRARVRLREELDRRDR